MTDTSVMQERIGRLCGQFKLPTVAVETVACFTAALDNGQYRNVMFTLLFPPYHFGRDGSDTASPPVALLQPDGDIG